MSEELDWANALEHVIKMGIHNTDYYDKETEMSIKIKLIKADSDFLQKFAHIETDVNGNDFYYMPYWFEKTGKGIYIQHTFDNLPTELKKRLQENREEKPKEPLY